MPITAVSDSQAWNEFLRAAQVARTRNAAFTQPSAAVEALSPTSNRKPSGVSVGQPVTRTYTPAEPVQEKAVLGTKFDSYA